MWVGLGEPVQGCWRIQLGTSNSRKSSLLPIPSIGQSVLSRRLRGRTHRAEEGRPKVRERAVWPAKDNPPPTVMGLWHSTSSVKDSFYPFKIYLGKHRGGLRNRKRERWYFLIFQKIYITINWKQNKGRSWKVSRRKR